MNEQQKIERLAGLVHLNSSSNISLEIGISYLAVVGFWTDGHKSLYTINSATTYEGVVGSNYYYTLDEMINLIVYIHANLPEKGE